MAGAQGAVRATPPRRTSLKEGVSSSPEEAGETSLQRRSFERPAVAQAVETQFPSGAREEGYRVVAGPGAGGGERLVEEDGRGAPGGGGGAEARFA